MPDNHTRQIVNKGWSFAHLLRDDGLSYIAYTEQITFLLCTRMSLWLSHTRFFSWVRSRPYTFSGSSA